MSGGVQKTQYAFQWFLVRVDRLRNMSGGVQKTHCLGAQHDFGGSKSR